MTLFTGDTGGKLFFQALRVLHTQFHMVGAFVNDHVNAGGSAILILKSLLHDIAVLTHLVTQQGRDHIVKISSAREHDR